MKYTLAEKVNPLKLQDQRKWYATAHSSGETSLRELCKTISARCTLTNADVMAVLESLLEVVPQEISRGHIVRLGDFGSFKLTIRSEGVENAEEFNAASHIKSNKLHFLPGQELKQVLNAVKYKKVST